MLSSGGQTKGQVRKTYLEYYLQLWFKNSTCRPNFFCKAKEHCLCAVYTKNRDTTDANRKYFCSMTATAHVKSSWVTVTDFKTRLLMLKPEVQILGSSKSIRQTKVEILRLKSCFLRKKETKLHANL